MLDALRGVEIVDGVTRLCAMNLLLHGVGPTTIDQGEPPVRTADTAWPPTPVIASTWC